MSRLLQPLDTLSHKHPEVFIQELASNLRAVIATHGAYRPDNLTAAAPASKDAEKTPTDAGTCTGAASSGGSATGRSPRDGGRHAGVSDPSSSSKALSDWLLDGCDPDVPTRAFALRVLTRVIQNKDPEALKVQEKILTVS